MNVIDKKASEYKVRGLNNAIFLTFEDALYAANGETSRIRVSTNENKGVDLINAERTAKKSAKINETIEDGENTGTTSTDADSVDTDLTQDA